MKSKIIMFHLKPQTPLKLIPTLSMDKGHCPWCISAHCFMDYKIPSKQCFTASSQQRERQMSRPQPPKGTGVPSACVAFQRRPISRCGDQDLGFCLSGCLRCPFRGHFLLFSLRRREKDIRASCYKRHCSFPTALLSRSLWNPWKSPCQLTRDLEPCRVVAPARMCRVRKTMWPEREQQNQMHH